MKTGKIKKVLFLVVPSISRDQLLNTGKKANRVELTPPYGPLSIISYIKSHTDESIDFKIIDLKIMLYNILKEGKSENDLAEQLTQYIREYKPDFIAISALFSLCYNHLSWIEKSIINSQSEAITIIGGALATGSYQNVLDDFPRIQMVSFGEGEIPCHAIITAEESLKSYISNSAVITRESLNLGMKPEPQYIQNLDEIPLYDFSYINLDKYTGIQYQEERESNKTIEIITSRGCPFDCVFCSCHLMYGKKIRYHSAERICSEIKRYVQMGFKNIRFYDENFFFDIERSKIILESIISLHDPDITIEYPNGMMTVRIDESMSEILKKAGLKKANLAVESGSEYVLKHIIKKPVTKQDVIKAVDSLKKFNIDINLFIVTGFPGETDQHRAETIAFIKSLNVDWAQILVATPFKGSRLYDICVENNYLYNYDITNISMRECHIKTPEYSPEYIDYIAYKMNLEINFINNYSIKSGNFTKAGQWFTDILGKFPKHAFAHYCMAICCKYLEQLKEAEYHHQQFEFIISEDEFWRKYALEFNLIDKSSCKLSV